MSLLVIKANIYPLKLWNNVHSSKILILTPKVKHFPVVFANHIFPFEIKGEGMKNFIYSLNKCLLSTCYVAGTELGGSRDTRMSTINIVTALSDFVRLLYEKAIDISTLINSNTSFI